MAEDLRGIGSLRGRDGRARASGRRDRGLLKRRGYTVPSAFGGRRSPWFLRPSLLGVKPHDCPIAPWFVLRGLALLGLSPRDPVVAGPGSQGAIGTLAGLVGPDARPVGVRRRRPTANAKRCRS